MKSMFSMFFFLPVHCVELKLAQFYLNLRYLADIKKRETEKKTRVEPSAFNSIIIGTALFVFDQFNQAQPKKAGKLIKTNVLLRNEHTR